MVTTSHDCKKSTRLMLQLATLYPKGCVLANVGIFFPTTCFDVICDTAGA